MPHVVTQSCVGDGSCVHVCPVNCIQPTPDDPAFELAEMLHIDPAACVDCGACVKACPVDAIKSHHALDPAEQIFAAINAGFYRERASRPLLAPLRAPLAVRDRGRPLRVAIVGSGPAAMYAAEEVLTIPGARVSVFERHERPFGLVRTGVAPDHRRTRRVSRQLDRIARHPRLTLHLGVEVGVGVTREELLAGHDAVVYAVGAAADRRLEIPGADLPGVTSAASLVGWYNGHPDHAQDAPDLSHPRVVVVGNGNVALDVARVLTTPPDALADTEIAPAALAVLRASAVREVVLVARRGPAESAFTLPELIGLRATPGVALRVDSDELDGPDPKLALLREPATEGARTITLRYRRTPERVLGTGRAAGLELRGPDGVERLDAGLVVSAIGYRGLPVAGLPFDTATGTVPNRDGRVVDPGTGLPVPGVYVAGWIKRGPTGFIGTNRGCAQDTVAALVADHNDGLLTSRRAEPRRSRMRGLRA